MRTNILKTMLNERYWYGGEVWKLGDIIIDLQKKAPNQQCVDRYLQGMLRHQTPIK